MAETTYPFSKTNDFRDRLVNHRLVEELKASALPAVRVDSDGDAVKVVMSIQLTASQETTMRAVVVGHDCLEENRNAQIEKIRIACESYVLKRYPLTRQSSFNLLLTEANSKNLVNRKARLEEWVAWGKTVLGYYYSRKDLLTAAGSHEEILAVTWDFEQFNQTDPEVGLREVAEMNN